jgi:hypothetical protein
MEQLGRLGDPEGPLSRIEQLAVLTADDRPLGRALAPGGPLDQLLAEDGVLERLLADGGPLDRLMAEGGIVDRLLRPEGPLDRLLAPDGALERLTVAGGPRRAGARDAQRQRGHAEGRRGPVGGGRRTAQPARGPHPRAPQP